MSWCIRKTEFAHYGIKGMRWGVRRTPEQLGHTTLRKAKTANLEKWGMTPETNALFITGISGSGKSTLAKSLEASNVDVIHLDTYFENKLYNRGKRDRSSSFDDYLKRLGVEPPGSVSYDEWKEKDYFTPFEKAVDSFGKEQYKKNRKVIAEGVQIFDEALNIDKSYYRNKPLIITSTNIFKSELRAFARDGFSVEATKNAIKYYSLNKSQLNSLIASTNAKRGSEWIEAYLKKEGPT